jgi:predicted phosphodiesterase
MDIRSLFPLRKPSWCYLYAMKNQWSCLWILVISGLFSCGAYEPWVNSRYADWQSKPLPAEAPEFSVFLSGDGGEPMPDGSDPYLRTLKGHLDSSDSHSALIFLGDNIYPAGLPGKSDPSRKTYEEILREQISVYERYPGRVFWVAGNHDWDDGHSIGLEKRLNQERFVEEVSARGNIYFPDSACPGPASVNLSSNAVLLLLDTQWWLHQYEKPRNRELCGVVSEEEMVAGLQAELAKHAGKTVFVAAHHPMETCGPHGGKYPLRSHIFPLLEFNRKWWIPMPVLGGMYVFARKSTRYIQDTHNKHYRRMVNAFEGVFNTHPGLVYVNGHDHSLQLIRKKNVNYITSGSASKISHVVRAKYLDFGFAGNGYVVVHVYADGQRWAEFFRTSGTGRCLVFRTKLN